MDQKYAPVLIVAASILAFWMLTPPFRRAVYRFFVGPPRLLVIDLPYLFTEHTDFQINNAPRRIIPGADSGIELYNDTVSITYHRTSSREGMVETVDVAHRGRSGIIFTIGGERVTMIEYMHGPIFYGPDLDIEEEEMLAEFMNKLRARVAHA